MAETVYAEIVRPVEYFDPETHRMVWRADLALSDAAEAVWQATVAHYDNVFEAQAFCSPLEGELLAAMWHYGLDPNLQAKFDPYRVDFYFPAAHVAVEVDGAGYHRGEKDWRRDQFLRREHDIIVRRYTGSQVYRDPLFCARDVKRVVTWINDRLHLVKAAA